MPWYFWYNKILTSLKYLHRMSGEHFTTWIVKLKISGHSPFKNAKNFYFYFRVQTCTMYTTVHSCLSGNRKYLEIFCDRLDSNPQPPVHVLYLTTRPRKFAICWLGNCSKQKWPQDPHYRNG